MKKMTLALMGLAFALTVTVSAYASDCCNGTSCCNGQTCCKKSQVK